MKILGLLLAITVVSCTSEVQQAQTFTKQSNTTQVRVPEQQLAQVVEPLVVKTLPHDTLAFTQGLTVWNGLFYESTGQYGVSDVRVVEINSGKVLRRERLGGVYFGEGSTVLNGNVFVVTWLNQRGFVFDAKHLSKKEEFAYNGEGWGLTTDGKDLYMSNGTDVISVLNETTKEVVRTIAVRLDGKPCRYLNELEWIDGLLWANVWQTDNIVCISPITGRVEKVINLSHIYPINTRSATADVLNGIAYNPATGSIYVTGKNWPHIYSITLPK